MGISAGGLFNRAVVKFQILFLYNIPIVSADWLKV